MQNNNESKDIEVGYVVTAPIFLLMTNQNCSLCGESNSVCLLATLNEPRKRDDISTIVSDEVFMLTYIEALPDKLYALILQRNPNYKIEHSSTTRSDYYMTVCECGGHYGDHYVSKQISQTAFLHPSEIRIEKLTNEGSWIIPCNFSYGGLNTNLLNKTP